MTKHKDHTQVDVLLDMIHAIEFYDEVITFKDAEDFAWDFAVKHNGPRFKTAHCFYFCDYFDFLEEVSALSGTWKNIRQMANTKAGAKKILKKFLSIARQMENWVI